MLPRVPAIAAVLLQAEKGEAGLLRARLLALPADFVAPAVPVALEGVVREVGSNGQIRIATSLGELQLQLAGALPVGREVTVMIRAGGRRDVVLVPARPLPGLPAPTTNPAGGPSRAAAPGNTAPALPAPAGAVTQASASLAPASMLAALALAEGPRVAGPGVGYTAGPVPQPSAALLLLLRETQRRLAADHPSAARALAHRMPAADPPGAVATVMLLAALRRGRLRDFLGSEIAQALTEGGRPDVLETIEAGLGRPEQRPAADDGQAWEWRPLPLFDRGAVLPMTIGIARDGNGERRQAGARRNARRLAVSRWS